MNEPQQTPATPAQAPVATTEQQAPIVAPPLPFTLKSNLKEYRKRLGILRIVLAFAISLFFLRFGVMVWLFSVIGLGVVIVLILFLLTKRQITINPDGLVYKGVFSSRSLSFADVSTVKVFPGYIEPGFGGAPRVIVGSKAGKQFLSVTSLYWNVEEIDQFIAVLQEKKVVVEAYEGPVLSTMIAKQFPAYVTVLERHPFLLAFAATGVILVAVVVFVLLTQ